MKLKAVLDTLEGLDEAFHGLYAKEGEKYVLQIDDFVSHPKAHGLSATVTKLRDENKGLKAAAGKWNELVELRGDDEDVSPESIHQALESSEGSDKAVETRIQDAVAKAVERAEAKAGKELDKVSKERDTLMASMRGRVVDGDLDAAIAKAGFIEKFRPAVRAILKLENPDMVEEDGKYRGIFRADPDGVPRDMPIEDYVVAFSKTERAAAFMPADGGGSGAKQSNGGGGGNGARSVKVENGMVVVDPASVVKGETRVLTS